MTRAFLSTLLGLLILATACGPRPPADEPPPPAEDAGTTAKDEPAPPPPPVEDATSAPDAPPPDEKPAEQDWGPETIVMAEGSKQGTITFGHKPHEDRIECMKCHHEMEDPKGEAQSCRDCHNPQATDTFGAKKAFHLQCLGCHKEEAKGPTKCAGCHKK